MILRIAVISAEGGRDIQPHDYIFLAKLSDVAIDSCQADVGNFLPYLSMNPIGGRMRCGVFKNAKNALFLF